MIKKYKLESEMKKLWKDTFHDNNAYVDLIFTHYFTDDNIEYSEDNGKVVSALFSIPYVLHRNGQSIKCRYLCGLATSMSYRGRGIMTQLIEHANQRAKDDGCAFTFLIPADEELRLYYGLRGYDNASYRIGNRYTDIHDFNRDFAVMVEGEEEKVKDAKLKAYERLEISVHSDGDMDEENEMIQFMELKEKEAKGYAELLHSEKDLHAVVYENHISGGKIILCRKPTGEICGVTFAVPEPIKKLCVQRMYYSTMAEMYKMLDYAKKLYAESCMTVYMFPELVRRGGLYSRYYLAPEAGGDSRAEKRMDPMSLQSLSSPYAMCRILSTDDVLKFVTGAEPESRISLFVRDSDDPSSVTHYLKSKNGDLKIERMSRAAAEEKSGLSVSSMMTERNLIMLMLRKVDKTAMISEVFGVPRLAMNMALLLD